MPIVLPLLLILTSSLLSAQDAIPEPKGSITGTVKTLSGLALGDVEVSIVIKGILTPKGKTDSTGSFSINGLDAGGYNLIFQRIPGGPRNRFVTLASGRMTARLTVGFEDTGRVSGKISDDAGSPLPGIDVKLYQKIYGPDGEPSFRIADSTRTNEAGAYSFRGVPAGRPLFIEARPAVQAGTAAPAASREDAGVLVPTSFPGARSLETAEPLILHPNEDRPGISFRMGRSATWCAEGIASSENGPPLPVRLSESNKSLPVSVLQSQQPQADGRFRFCGLPPGAYVITSNESAPTGAASEAVEFRIVKQDVRGLRLTVRPPAAVSVRVELDNSTAAAIAPAITNVSLLPIGGGAGVTTRLSGPLPLIFEFPAVACGEYRLAAGTQSGSYVKEVLQGGVSVPPSRLRICSDGAATDLRIRLGTDGGSVTVKVVDSDDRPVSGTMVAIFPAGVRSLKEMLAGIGLAATNDAGEYVSRTLAPGIYAALATGDVADSYSPSAADYDRLFRRSSQARSVEIGPKQSEKLTVKLP